MAARKHELDKATTKAQKLREVWTAIDAGGSEHGRSAFRKVVATLYGDELPTFCARQRPGRRTGAQGQA